ncbi:type I 3-dehydroquinate dehydratase [Loigolactobacillus coryniformis]|uniref:type I 3-dehydroquinate dehydratase n=1 Tax=Loigolactobacillus coryniformis TaxID=1610 RepID=UPI00345DA00A
MATTVVKLKQVELGSGRPKIAVPITGENQVEVLAQATAIVQAKPDIVEWRLDYFQNILNVDDYRETAIKLIERLNDIPLLTTFRTEKEGGEMTLGITDYVSIYQQVISNHLTDALDLELFLPKTVVSELVAAAQDADIAVIMSSHDFQKTPVKEEIISRLEKMDQLGADVAKIAVMPQSGSDVATLLAATAAAHEKLKTPIISMAMGKLGKVSRISGEVFGSVLTFGTVGSASAPGQIELPALRREIAQLALDKM